jgi:hypothetical protein
LHVFPKIPNEGNHGGAENKKSPEDLALPLVGELEPGLVKVIPFQILPGVRGRVEREETGEESKEDGGEAGEKHRGERGE